MRTWSLALVLSLALGATWITSACLVDTRSDKLACSTTPDCKDATKVCTGGYCIDSPCSAACDSCDTGTTPPTCHITGGGHKSVSCPAGTKCVVDCNGGSACGSISCAPGEPCVINCSGTNACGSINCSGACSCEVNGCETAGTCSSFNCPRAMGNNYCTASGANDEPCITTATNCNKC